MCVFCFFVCVCVRVFVCVCASPSLSLSLSLLLLSLSLCIYIYIFYLFIYLFVYLFTCLYNVCTCTRNRRLQCTRTRPIALGLQGFKVRASQRTLRQFLFRSILPIASLCCIFGFNIWGLGFRAWLVNCIGCLPYSWQLVNQI